MVPAAFLLTSPDNLNSHPPNNDEHSHPKGRAVTRAAFLLSEARAPIGSPYSGFSRAGATWLPISVLSARMTRAESGRRSPSGVSGVRLGALETSLRLQA